MQEKIKRISPYEYIEGAMIKEEYSHINSEITPEYIGKLFTDKEYKKAEFALLEALYRHPFLIRKTMERYADFRLGSKKYSSYGNMIKRLWQDGCLRRFSYEGTRLYCLAEGARAYMKNRLDKDNHHDICLPGVDEASILENAALAQWHISVMTEEKVRKVYFCEDVKIAKRRVHVPSYLEVDKGKYLYKVLSFTVPKTGAGMEQFLEGIYTVWDCLVETHKSIVRKEIYLIVLVCTGIPEMENCAKILAGLSNTGNLPLYFVAEANTTFTKGLDLLYTIKRDAETIILETITVN